MIILFSLGGYIVDINPLKQQLKFQKNNNIIKKLKLKQHKTEELNYLKIQQQKSKALYLSYNENLNLFTDDFSIINILSCIEKTSLDTNTNLQTIEPQTIKTNEIFTIYSVKCEINGQYHNLIKFINGILNQKYLAAFDNITIQKNNENNNELNMQILLLTYKHKAPLKNKTINISKSLPKNPTITLPQHDFFAKTTNKTNLCLWTVAELRFLGLLKNGVGTYGIVSDPFGVIHEVTIGNKVGIEQNKILRIDDFGISIIDKNGKIHLIGTTNSTTTK